MTPSEWKNKKWFTLWDGILLLLAIALCLVAIFARPRKSGEIADVYVDGVLVASLSLDEEGEYRVETEKGYNCVVVSGGAVRIAEADCPDGICTAGSIKNQGAVITCLPHGVKVVVRGKAEGVDG